MKKFVEDNVKYWYLVVTALLIVELCNQKLFVTMLEPLHSLALSCVIISILFCYLSCLLNCVVDFYVGNRKVSDEALLQRIEVLETTLTTLDEKNKELESQLIAQSIENANNLYNLTLDNMNSAFKINQNYMENQFAELEVQNRNDNESLKDIVYEQNKVVQDICSNIDNDLKEKCEALNNVVVEKVSDVVEKLSEEINYAKANKEAIVAELANVEAKQAESIANAVEQLNAVSAENHKAVLATMDTARELASANKEAIVAELVNVEVKQAEGIANAVDKLNAISVENQKVVLATMDTVKELASANKEAIVAELANVEAKQVQQSQKQVVAFENAIKQIEEVNIANNKVIESVKQIIDGDVSKNNYAENLLAIENIAKENKAALANGFNNLAQKQKTTFENMHKQFDLLEALVNNSRVDLYNRFELLKNEQKDTFANVLDQIDQLKSATKDTIANEIAKLSIIEDILADEFEENVEQPKYDASKPAIEVGDKYQVSKKKPNRVEMIVDDKLGTTLKNTYKNNKLSSSQIISNGKVTYEVTYDANERPAKSKSYDATGKINIELEYYENGQVKKRIQNVKQNGSSMRQITNFDVNGNKI